MKIPFYQAKARKDGSTIHGINPPTSYRQALGVRYASFPTLGEAADYAVELQEQYRAYRAGQKAIKASPATVQGMCDRYLASKEFGKRAKNTQRSYQGFIRLLCAAELPSRGITLGKAMGNSLSKNDAKGLYAALCDEYSDHRAFHAMKVIRLVFNAVGEQCRVTKNPFSAMRLDTPESRDIVWTKDHIDTAIKTADELGYTGLGTLILLCHDLCQRPGDMRQLMHGNSRNHFFHFTQEKTRTDMILPYSPALMERLKRLNHGVNDPTRVIVVNDKTGQGFTARDYNQQFEEVKKMAQLPADLWISDLRRTGATELAAAGASEDEIATQTGHVDRNIIGTYVRPTKNLQLAMNAMQKRFGSPPED